MKPLEGKTAFVTGAAQGNGFGISKVLMEKGACVIMTDKSGIVKESEKKLEEMTGQRGSISYIMDVTQADSVEEVVKDAESRVGSIDI